METYLQLHERLLKEGLTEKSAGYNGGLCGVVFNGEELEDNELFSLFEPDEHTGSYWAYNGTAERVEECLAGTPHPRRYKYTPLRQNIILLLAALNNEL